MMKVLIVQGSTWKEGGGVETFVNSLIKSKIMSAVNFTVVYPLFYKTKKHNNLSRCTIDECPIYVPIDPQKKIFKPFVNIYFNFALLISKDISSRKYDIMHINGVSGALLALKFRKITVFTIHGNSLESYRSQKKYLNTINKIFNLLNSLISFIFEVIATKFSYIAVSVSNTTKSNFYSVRKKSKILVIPNGVIARRENSNAREVISQKYNLEHNSFICLWVGRNPERKGLNIAIKSVEKNSSAVLMIVGFKSDKTSNGNLVYCGQVKSEELTTLYHSADALIFPSHYEAMSYVILEAVSIGLPIIGFRKNFLIDILGPDYPLLCDSEDEFAERVNFLVNISKIDLEKIKLKTLEIGKKYNVDNMASSYYRIYQGIEHEFI